MSGQTPILGLTIPDINDLIPAWPGIAAQGLADLENSLIIDLKTAAEPHDVYPIGMSMFGLTTSGATEGGWPSGSGMVISWRRPLADITFQLKVSQGVDRGPNVFARTGGSFGWSPWSVSASRELPVAVAVGSVTFNDLVFDTMVEMTVALPEGVFTSKPTVMLTNQTTAPAAYMTAISAASATSFSLRANRRQAGTGSVTVNWQATQPGV